jgi:hypothetical protein
MALNSSIFTSLLLFLNVVHAIVEPNGAGCTLPQQAKLLAAITEAIGMAASKSL